MKNRDKSVKTAGEGLKTANVSALCMIVAAISFLGFVVENLWLLFTKGYMDNRNMCFPFLFGYGIAILMIYIICGTPKRVWFFGIPVQLQRKMNRFIVYLIAVMVCISVGEIVLGTFVEKTCHFHWWDYSSVPLNITRYTSIPTSAMLALLVTVFMDYCFAPLYEFFRKWNCNILNAAALILMVIIVGDFLYNAYRMYEIQGMVRRWRIDVAASIFF